MMPVAAPFTDVAMHVVQTESVWLARTDGDWPYLSGLAEDGEFAECHFIASATPERVATAAAGIFPLSLCRQIIRARFEQTGSVWLTVQPVAESLGICPTDSTDRSSCIAIVRNKEVLPCMATFRSGFVVCRFHKLEELSHGHFVHTDVERFRQCDQMFRATRRCDEPGEV